MLLLSVKVSRRIESGLLACLGHSLILYMRYMAKWPDVHTRLPARAATLLENVPPLAGKVRIISMFVSASMCLNSAPSSPSPASPSPSTPQRHLERLPKTRDSTRKRPSAQPAKFSLRNFCGEPLDEQAGYLVVIISKMEEPSYHFLIREAEFGCHSYATRFHQGAVDKLNIAGCHDYRMAITFYRAA